MAPYIMSTKCGNKLGIKFIKYCSNFMLLFISLLTICIISRAEIDFFIPCIPDLQQKFGLSSFMAQLSLSLNFIGYCIGILLSGILGDKFNYRTIILYHLLFFILATLLCVITSNYKFFLLGRFIQGISIASPTILIYAILIEHSKFNNRLKKLGYINGLLALSMVIIPTIGSHLGLYSHWRLNFFVLLCLSVLAMLLSNKTIQSNRNLNNTSSISLKSYLPLLKSRKILLFIASLCFMITPYWIFISMSSIYYVNDLGLSLIEYVYHKDILAIIFGLVSIMNGLLIKNLGGKNCLFLSIGLCLLSIICLIMIISWNINEPVIITSAMAILASGAAFLINFLYANALSITEHDIGKISALIHSVRLILTSLSLSLVSKLYCGNFTVIGIALISMLFTGILLVTYLYKLDILKGV